MSSYADRMRKLNAKWKKTKPREGFITIPPGRYQQEITAATFDNKKFIVATDRGIFYKMQQLCPEKEFFEAPTAGEGATCRSCAHCPWMAMNGLKAIKEALIDPSGKEVFIDMTQREGALKSLNRMLNFNAQQ